MKIRSIFITLLFCFGASFAANSPVAMLDATATKLIKQLKANRSSLQEDPDKVFSIVRVVILPKIDVRAMSRSVLGRNIWKKASGQQRTVFQTEFVKLVIRTYARALAKYRDETIKFFPVRGGTKGKSRVQVKSLIRRNSGPDIPISYRLRQLNGQWLVYDFSVEGVSLVQSFRSQFRAQLAHGNLDNLIATLRKHNQRRKT